jgi:hypothetical protein
MGQQSYICKTRYGSSKNETTFHSESISAENIRAAQQQGGSFPFTLCEASVFCGKIMHEGMARSVEAVL